MIWKIWTGRMLLGSISFAWSQAQAPTPSTTSSSHFVGVRGTYSNCDYGYAVTLPKRVDGEMPAAPAASHGLRLTLQNQPWSENIRNPVIWVDATYNVQGYKTVEEVGEHLFDAGNNPKNAVPQVPRQPAKLGGLSAIRVRRNSVSTTGIPWIEEQVLALRQREDGVGIIYTVGLAGPLSAEPQLQAIVGELLASFQVKTLAKDPCSNKVSP